jgi:hypothetical protein
LIFKARRIYSERLTLFLREIAQIRSAHTC